MDRKTLKKIEFRELTTGPGINDQEKGLFVSWNNGRVHSVTFQAPYDKNQIASSFIQLARIINQDPELMTLRERRRLENRY